MIKKILIIPPMPWYMEAHAEYLIRYLSDEFFIEIADVPYPPYENFIARFPETYPFQRNPDDYDLLFPLLATHWVITMKEKYRHKIAQVWYQPDEADAHEIAVLGAATPFTENSITNRPFHSLRFGIDTELFKPYKMVREDTLLHVGMVGNLLNPRRMTTEIVKALKDVPGIRLMLFLTKRPKTNHDMDFIGGMETMEYIVSGEKIWCGLPNIYNRLDVLIRCDSDPGYSFPVLEAAACGVPVITTDSGVDSIIFEANGGLLIPGNRQYYLSHPEEVAKKVKEGVIFFRDNREIQKAMGFAGRKEITKNWQWDRFIPAWRDFFREGIKNATK